MLTEFMMRILKHFGRLLHSRWHWSMHAAWILLPMLTAGCGDQTAGSASTPSTAQSTPSVDEATPGTSATTARPASDVESTAPSATIPAAESTAENVPIADELASADTAENLPAAAPAVSAAQPSVKQPPPRPQAAPVVDQKSFAELVRPFLTKHCVECHGADLAEAKLRLDTLAADFVNRPASDQWVEVLDRINLGEMPPEGEPRPDADELAQVTDWITSEMQHARRQTQSTGGRVLLRRLSRTEYVNSIRDLLQVEFAEGSGLREMLPPDGSIGGFDKVSKALLLDPSLMEAYLTAAREIAGRAIVTRPPLVPQRTLRFEFDETPNSAMSYILHGRPAYLDGPFMVLMESSARTFSKLRHPFNVKEIPVTGRYRVRVRAAADPGQRGDPIYMDVTYGSEGRQARFRVDATRDSPQIYEFEKTFDAAIPGEFQAGLVNGTRFREGNAEWYHLNGVLTKLAEGGQPLEATRMKARLRAEGAYDSYVRGSYLPQALQVDPLPKLYLDWIEVIGPLQGVYPPPSMETIFGARDVQIPTGSEDAEQTLALARSAFERLLPRAFRRPVKPQEIDQLTALVRDELSHGAAPDEALRTGLVALLCAPDFLFLFEPQTEEQSAAAPRKLTGYELATRLSYFVWSSLPDAELTTLARNGRLHEPATLAAQVDRLLADARSEGLVQGFARQWLKIGEIGRFKPDEQIYPRFYATEMAGVDRDVEAEPLAFFREVLGRDEPVDRFLDSDWLMLNERLARLYGIDGVTGEALRRVPLKRTDDAPAEQVRGGLLGMAGVHLWGADGNRTKPVERGKYVLDVLFNDPPPPPPPNAGEVEPNLRGQKLSVRDRLARHREQTTCNNCHRRIDPFGLALENFNAIGQWRDQQDGEMPLRQWGENRPPVDPSGTLPNGRAFSDYKEFRAALLDQRARFVRGLAEKLFVYALGRTVEPADRPAIDAIVAGQPAAATTLRQLIRAVVLTSQFQSK